MGKKWDFNDWFFDYSIIDDVEFHYCGSFLPNQPLDLCIDGDRVNTSHDVEVFLTLEECEALHQFLGAMLEHRRKSS